MSIFFFFFCLSLRQEHGVTQVQETHPDFDDFTVEAVERNDHVASIGRRIRSIVPGKN